MPPVPPRRITPQSRLAPSAPVAPRGPAPRAQASTARPAASSGYRGAAGLAMLEQEQAAAAARREVQQTMQGMPFRFRTPPGETREIIIVDDRPDFFRHEHNVKDAHGKWTVFTSCIAANANCPVCIANPDRLPYFAIYLTVIDLTPYTSKNGEDVQWSKKLLVIKPAQQKKFMRLYDRLGSLRGVHLAMTRDGEKDASIGNDLEHVATLTEDDLAEYVNVYTDTKGKEITVVGGEPFDYDALFPAQNEQMLAALVGGRMQDFDSSNRLIGRHHATSDGWDDEPPVAPTRAARPAPASVRPAPVRAPATRPARSAREEPPWSEAELADDEAIEPAPRDARRLVSARGDEAEDVPQRGVGARRPAPAPVASARPVRRAAVPIEPEEEEPQEETPAPARSLAAQRMALRGGR